MIYKIKKIKNIGRFQNFESNECNLAKKSIFFGINGSGKSTLARIFSSVNLNQPRLITKKRSFDAIGDQEVIYVLNEVNGPEVRFENGSWQDQGQKYLVFDSRFISQNIFDSEKLLDEHRFNLHRVVIGERGKLLAGEIDTLIEKLHASEQEINVKKRLYTASGFEKVFKIEEFLNLKNDSDIDEKIAKLQSQKDYFFLTNKPALPTLKERLDTSFRKVLEENSDSLHVDAKSHIQVHISTHWSDASHSEEFLNEGIKLLKENNCPFCAQDLTPSLNLIDSYRKIYDEVYSSWQERVKTAVKNFLTWKISDNLEILKRDIFSWQNYIPEACGDVSGWLKANEKELLDAKLEFDNECQKKLSNIQNQISFQSLEKVERLILELDEIVEKLNLSIKNFKDKIETQNVDDLNTEILKLKAQKVRFEKYWDEFYLAYITLLADSIKIKESRDKQIVLLSEYSQEVFSTHQRKINEVLESLGADFRVDNLNERVDRRKSKPMYCGFDLIFFGRHRVSTEDTGEENADLNSALSQGGRNLLAFAFFIASISNDPKLSEKIVVIDDPISSFDKERKSGTVDLLASMMMNSTGATPKQLIVLTHDVMFLSDICSNYEFRPGNGTQYLTITSKHSENEVLESSIRAFDPYDDLLKIPDIKLYEKIHSLAFSGDDIPTETQSLCRILLESIIKLKYWPYISEIATDGGYPEFVNKLNSLGIYDEPKKNLLLSKNWLYREPHHSGIQNHRERSSSEVRVLLKDVLELVKIV